MPNDIEYLTVDQASEALQCSSRTVLSMIAKGRLPGAVKVGREYRIPRADIAALFDQKRREREQARAGRDAAGASSGAGATA